MSQNGASEKTQYYLVEKQNIRYVTYEDVVKDSWFESDLIAPRIVILLPAHNEEMAISSCLEGIADQKLPSGIQSVDILLGLDNCTDRTEERAIYTANKHNLNLIIYKTENNAKKKVGCLTQLYSLLHGNSLRVAGKDISRRQQRYVASIEAIMSIDADTRMEKGCMIELWEGLKSDSNIGGVMAKYTMLYPVSKRKILEDDPHYQDKMESGAYGGPIARWWIARQKIDMASWTLQLFTKGRGRTYVLGGQTSMFNPDALEAVRIAQGTVSYLRDDTQVEDMALTWMIEKCGYKALVSPTARCYVDGMRNYKSYVAQRDKWKGGLIELLANRDKIRTQHTGQLWREQIKMGLDLLTRVLFVVMVILAIYTNQYYWSWVWAIPPAVACILNTVLAIKTYRIRPIDVIMSALLISPEIYLWVNLLIWIRAWMRHFSVKEFDGWGNQYAAEKGLTRSKLSYVILFILGFFGSVIYLGYKMNDYFKSDAFIQFIHPYFQAGFTVLSILTIFQTLAMLYQLWQLRTPYKA
ncbi:glycosyltransferase family 2 protein [Sporolactobacillus spathodeae]|uniref:Cellulose synthase/poly-beta-1,6-N-acetylglucosamine synthase-like glycosyltransferase n=1 Tax=Sporolactobacillus spathodeae TaxID=1465502 RepID=A0ABS2Q8H0_9BACL|nr:glycosyltransferase family 2 protein [Sporolactobacillus spathodeae]MBM7658090.1 cellulose synthase/poly-beta-1,6-N-acetylglucosamine synthase-like glycosyltransferase [Sporolactobacillus spathodeae]